MVEHIYVLNALIGPSIFVQRPPGPYVIIGVGVSTGLIFSIVGTVNFFPFKELFTTITSVSRRNKTTKENKTYQQNNSVQFQGRLLPLFILTFLMNTSSWASSSKSRRYFFKGYSVNLAFLHHNSVQIRNRANFKQKKPDYLFPGNPAIRLRRTRDFPSLDHSEFGFV